MIGQIIQFRPAFENIQLPSFPISEQKQNIKIGISISEKDFMKWGADEYNNGFFFSIYPNDVDKDNNKTLIKMGKTCMYETELILANGINIDFSYNTVPNGSKESSFKNLCPQSTLVEIVY